MKQNLIKRLVGVLFLSILIVKTVVYFVPFVVSHLEEATLTELMLEQKEGKGKESLKETSVKEYFLCNFAYWSFQPSVLLSGSAVDRDVNFLCTFFPSIPTPPPNC